MALALGLIVAALVAAGCQATLDVDVDLDRSGRGTMTLRLELDREAQAAVGIDPAWSDSQVVAHFAPLLEDGGWSAAGAQLSVDRDESSGAMVLLTRRPIDSPGQLHDILSRPRSIPGLARAEDRAALPGLPAQVPLLNAVDVRLGDGSGDNPGFDLFARGGVGDIGEESCTGSDVAGFGRTLRDSLEITYRFHLPGGPGSTNADETPAGDNVWHVRYGDCPPLQASSGGGSSSTLVNGLILAALTGLLMIIFASRAIRRRRNRRSSP
ncbi:MAG: hypothetical protein AB7V42_14215 [Thermoleophilia bacterium]